jgi:NAD(P)-dependent dehydrogenase (short-subunit alcohol dehydrogenase family)
MRIDLASKSAIVTGAGGGIGRAVCLGLAAAGASVLAVDLSETAGRETEALGRATGYDIRFHAADVRDEASVKAYVDAAAGAFGGVDIFMNNAGWQGQILPLSDYPVDVFDQVMAINVRGVFLGLKHVLPVMTRNGRGAVVNTASFASHVATRNLAPYVASKHAVLGLTKTAALEVARSGVRVNAVCPGPVVTAMIDEIETGQAGGNLDELRRKRTASIPDGRYATPEEVADLMIYLASDRSGHITGQGIHINGGSHAI